MKATPVHLRTGLAAAAAGLLTVHLAACGATGDSGMVGLPPTEFQRAYAAGYDVAAAERCGRAVDAGRVRHNLVEGMKQQNVAPEIVEKAGRTFDKTRTEFTQKLRSRPEYCVTEYAIPSERLAQYEKGEFSPR